MSTINDRLFGDANEKFVGTKRNEAQAEKYSKILDCAKCLVNAGDIFNSFTLNAEDPNNNKSQNCMLYIDAESPVLLLDGYERALLGEMVSLCDVFTTAVAEDKQHVRYSFGVNNVWSK